MNLYAIKDIKEKSIGRGIFLMANDQVAIRSIASTLFTSDNPIGLEDKILVHIGDVDLETGIVKPNKDNVIRDVKDLKTIFDETIKVKKSYVK